MRVWNGTPVPYITGWSGERDVSTAHLVTTRDGLFYRDEAPEDRDSFGFLWARFVGDAGYGEPEFVAIHSERQRSAMENLWCQCCAGEASRTKKGTLFLLPGTDSRRAEDEVTSKPPLCLTCAQISRDRCPHGKRLVAVRVKKAPLWGIYGVLHLKREGLTAEALTSAHAEMVPYGASTARDRPIKPRHMLAYHLLRQLRRVTPVDLARELQDAHIDHRRSQEAP
jgi:hypothetical protein